MDMQGRNMNYFPIKKQVYTRCVCRNVNCDVLNKNSSLKRVAGAARGDRATLITVSSVKPANSLLNLNNVHIGP